MGKGERHLFPSSPLCGILLCVRDCWDYVSGIAAEISYPKFLENDIGWPR